MRISRFKTGMLAVLAVLALALAPRPAQADDSYFFLSGPYADFTPGDPNAVSGDVDRHWTSAWSAMYPLSHNTGGDTPPDGP